MKIHLKSFLRQRLTALLLATAACFIWSSAAQADTKIYMQYEGIAGSVTTSGFENWIELASINFGAGRGISAPTGGSTNRDTSAPSLSEINATCVFDPKAHPLLFLASCSGAPKLVKIHVVSDAAGTGAPFMPLKLELEKVLISGFNSSTSTGDAGAGFCNITLNFTKITLTTIPLNPATGQPGAPVTKFWDLVTNAGG